LQRGGEQCISDNGLDATVHLLFFYPNYSRPVYY
jgi:hypothetical protein